MSNNCHPRKKKCLQLCKETRDIGFVLLVFGAVTICAFFLPPKAWLILLGVILIICGFTLMKKWRTHVSWVLQISLSLNGTVYFVRSDASSTYISFSDCSVFFSNSYRLNISVPFSSRVSYGVRNTVSRNLAFSANFTFSWHLPHLL